MLDCGTMTLGAICCDHAGSASAPISKTDKTPCNHTQVQLQSLYLFMMA